MVRISKVLPCVMFHRPQQCGKFNDKLQNRSVDDRSCMPSAYPGQVSFGLERATCIVTFHWPPSNFGSLLRCCNCLTVPLAAAHAPCQGTTSMSMIERDVLKTTLPLLPVARLFTASTVVGCAFLWKMHRTISCNTWRVFAFLTATQTKPAACMRAHSRVTQCTQHHRRSSPALQVSQ